MIAGSLSDALNCSADVNLWPIADVETRFRTRPLSGVKRTYGGHRRIFRV